MTTEPGPQPAQSRSRTTTTTTAAALGRAPQAPEIVTAAGRSHGQSECQAFQAAAWMFVTSTVTTARH